MSQASCRLYLITPPRLEDPGALPGFTEDLKRALGGGDVACLQLRLKKASDDHILTAAEEIIAIAHANNVAVIMNDRPDLAQRSGADGVHIGQQDASLAEARALLGPAANIGVTCHASRHLAMEAGDGGADYVAFGAFFPTMTKETKAIADVDLLHWWSGLFEAPCVAIGGITPQNCEPLIAAGADFLAVSGGVWDHKDGPAAAVEHFNACFRQSQL